MANTESSSAIKLHDNLSVIPEVFNAIKAKEEKLVDQLVKFSLGLISKEEIQSAKVTVD